MHFIDEIIDFINKNVDSWVIATLILLWAIIFPQYTGIHFNGDFKRPGSDRKSTRLNSSHVRTSRMPSSA